MAYGGWQGPPTGPRVQEYEAIAREHESWQSVIGVLVGMEYAYNTMTGWPRSSGTDPVLPTGRVCVCVS